MDNGLQKRRPVPGLSHTSVALLGDEIEGGSMRPMNLEKDRPNDIFLKPELKYFDLEKKRVGNKVL